MVIVVNVYNKVVQRACIKSFKRSFGCLLDIFSKLLNANGIPLWDPNEHRILENYQPLVVAIMSCMHRIPKYQIENSYLHIQNKIYI